MNPGLKTLECRNSAKLSEIPIIKDLDELYCSYCPSLVTITIIPGLYKSVCKIASYSHLFKHTLVW